MKIETFQKLKNGQYKLKLEDQEELVVFEDLILKYDLLLHKEISEEQKDQLQKENVEQQAYYDALKYLKVRLRSVKEMADYLKRRGYSQPNIDFATSKLITQGYLNDQTFAHAYVQDALLCTLHGPLKIRSELEKKGIERNLIEEALQEISPETLQERIAKLIYKKQKMNHNKSNQILKQKIMMDLITQGYPKALIQEELAHTTFKDDLDLRKKEQEKLYEKLKKKYTGQELEYKVRQKMYQKGFTYEEE